MSPKGAPRETYSKVRRRKGFGQHKLRAEEFILMRYCDREWQGKGSAIIPYETKQYQHDGDTGQSIDWVFRVNGTPAPCRQADGPLLT